MAKTDKFVNTKQMQCDGPLLPFSVPDSPAGLLNIYTYLLIIM